MSQCWSARFLLCSLHLSIAVVINHEINIYSFFLSSILLPIDGIIIFNDQTVISGDVEIDNKSVSIIPDGLNFPEDILLQSIDSVKIKNGMIPIANGKVIFYYQNGEFLDPQNLEIINNLTHHLIMNMLNMFLYQTGV